MQEQLRDIIIPADTNHMGVHRGSGGWRGQGGESSVEETSLWVGRQEERASFVRRGSVTNKLGIQQPSEPIWPI